MSLARESSERQQEWNREKNMELEIWIVTLHFRFSVHKISHVIYYNYFNLMFVEGSNRPPERHCPDHITKVLGQLCFITSDRRKLLRDHST